MGRSAFAWRTLACLFVCANFIGVGAVNAADFAGSGVGAIPENNPAGINVTFSVSGIAMPIKRVQLTLTLTHTYIGDLEATLTSPGGIAHLLILGRIGSNSTNGNGFPSNLGGKYTFDDSGGDLWVAAGAPLTSTNTVPPSRYRTSTGGTILSSHGGCATSLAGAFGGLSGTNTNGTWTLKIADRATGDTGSISSAILTVLDDNLFTDSFDAVRGTCKLAQFDFTGTGRSSYVVVRNTGGGSSGAITWFIQDNDGTLTGAPQSFIHGIASDTVLSGDFDGDGISDAAVWSPGVPSGAQFIVRRSSRPNSPLVVPFGQPGDDPKQVGDYDGDGFDDFAVYRAGVASGNPSHTLIHLTRGGLDRDFITGENGAFASGGIDYTGDGRADVAIQANAGGGTASFRIFDGSTGALVNTFNFGTPTDVLVVGNHAGNFLYDITTVHGSGGNIVWATRDSGTGIGQPSVNWGLSATDFPLSGDFDGDGLDDYAIWRPNANPAMTIFYIRPSANPGTPITLNFGQNGDYPVENSRSH